MIKTDECSVPCQARAHAEFMAEYYAQHNRSLAAALKHTSARNRQLYTQLRNAVICNRIFISSILILLGVVVWLLFM